MIPNQSGLPGRALLAAALICGFLNPSTGVRAEGRSPNGWTEVDRPVAGSAGGATAARPTITTFRWSWIGPAQQTARLDIGFSEPVNGFASDDFQFTCPHSTTACVTVAALVDVGTNARSFSARLEMPRDYDGLVTVHIPADRVYNNSNPPEWNLPSTTIVENVDTRAPRRVVAGGTRISGDKVDILFNEELDRRFVPAVKDFAVGFTRKGAFDRRLVTRVEVSTHEVFLYLDSPVEAGDVVEVIYFDTGPNTIRDLIGNRASGFQLPGCRPSVFVECVSNHTGTTPTGLPGAPRNLTAAADGADAIDLEWDRPSSEGGARITGYLIEWSEDGRDPWSTLVRTRDTATVYRDEDVSAGETRHYRVLAVNFNGEGPASNGASATTEHVLPGAPRRLEARARGDSAIDLRWSAPASPGSTPITGYRIDVSRTGTGGWSTLVANTGSTATTYRHAPLQPNTTRYYRVAAINRAGNTGLWSDVSDATTEAAVPGAPTGLRAVPDGVRGTDRIVLSWSAPGDDGGSSITGYRIWWRSTVTSDWVILVGSTGSTGTTYLHTGLAPASTQFYRVSAINSKGTGPSSNVAEGTTNAGAPGPPQNVRARGTGPKSILLAWDRPETDGGERITAYAIQRIGPNDNQWVTHRSTTGSTATTITDTGLEPVTRYQYRVAAINRVGTGEWAPMPPALPASAITHADLAGAPTGLTAREVGTARIDLAWNAPRYTGGVSIIGHRIEASDDGGATWNIIRRNTNSTATTFSDVNLRPATTRHYRVAAINLAGPGAWSNTARATTDATVPGVPRRLSAEAAGTSQITLSWQAPSDDGGARITGYRIEASEDGGRSWEDLVGNTRTTATVYTHGGLAPASTRHYRVSAVNRVGVGDASRVAGSTTDATVPDAPTGLVANDVTPTQIDLFWIAPDYNGGARITGYRIEVSEDAAIWSDLVTNTESTVTAFSHTGLQPGSTRHYRVSAINRAGTGAASASASAATDDPVQRAGRLNTRVLPHVAAAMTSSTVSAIGGRVDAVARRMGMARRVETNGLSSMAASLSAPGASGTGLGLAQGDQAGLAALFGGTSFQMPFGASDAQQQSATGTQLASWGAGEYHHMGEPGAAALDWKGNMVSAHVGVDVRVGPNILAGVAGSYSSGSFDFTDRTGARPVAGTYGTTMTSVHPYVAWFSVAPGTSVWGSAGFGRGDVEVDDVREGLRTSPASMITGAGGASYQLLARGAGGVRVKAEGWAGQVVVDGTEQIDEVTLNMQRGKLALELTQALRRDTESEMAFMLEGGMRYDNGDGVNGASAEVGGGLRYTNSNLGLTAEGRGRFVISARDGYEEWGLGGTLTFDPAARGEGLSIRVAPSYGDHASGVNQLWERGMYDAVGGHDPGMDPNVNGEAAYGIADFQGTPYGGFYLAESGMRAFSSGVRYDLGADVGLRFEGTRRESRLGGAQHTVGVRGRIRFR